MNPTNEHKIADDNLSVYAAVILSLHEDYPNSIWGKKRSSKLIAGAEKRLSEYTAEELKYRVKSKVGIDLR